MVEGSQFEEHQLLFRKWRGQTLHETYALDEGRVLKRYWVRPGVRRFPRPWQREHDALGRLSGMGFGETYGYSERPHNNGWEAALTRDHLAGASVDKLQEDEIAGLAALLATLHRRGVLVGRPEMPCLLRRADGALAIAGLGTSTVVPLITLPVCFRLGRDLAAVGQHVLAAGPDQRALLDAYLGMCSLPWLRKCLVRWGFHALRRRLERPAAA